MASAQICPVVGTTTSVLPPNHPSFNADDSSLRCPVTNATVQHHEDIHKHPASNNIPNDSIEAMDAQSCPALKKVTSVGSVKEETCPVVGPVSAYLPPDHPNPADAKEGAVCPVTNAKLEHHAGKVYSHPKVMGDIKLCPVAGPSA